MRLLHDLHDAVSAVGRLHRGDRRPAATGRGAQGLRHPAQRRTLLFQQAFLDNIRRNGRLAELELVGQFEARAFWSDLSLPQFFKDAMLAPQLWRRGKLRVRNNKVKDRDVVRRVCFAQV